MKKPKIPETHMTHHYIRFGMLDLHKGLIETMHGGTLLFKITGKEIRGLFMARLS